MEIGGGTVEYAMAYTPYPPNQRENPSIAVSVDGITWATPAGLTNPISLLAEAQANNHSYWSDTDLVHLADGSWRCYFRGAGNAVSIDEKIWFKDSADLVTWGALTECLDAENANAIKQEIPSPAVVIEADGSFSMWVCNVDRNVIEKRTSADGTSFQASAVTDCTHPAIRNPIWHIDVIRDGATHYALLSDQSDLFFLTSTDGGVAWTGGTAPSIGRRFAHWPEYYRSGFQRKPDGSFKVWVSGKRGASTPPDWLLGYYDGIRFGDYS